MTPPTLRVGLGSLQRGAGQEVTAGASRVESQGVLSLINLNVEKRLERVLEPLRRISLLSCLLCAVCVTRCKELSKEQNRARWLCIDLSQPCTVHTPFQHHPHNPGPRRHHIGTTLAPHHTAPRCTIPLKITGVLRHFPNLFLRYTMLNMMSAADIATHTNTHTHKHLTCISAVETVCFAFISSTLELPID